MSVTVVLSGMPMSVTLNDIAYNLDKLFDTDEIGTFKVRKLHPANYRIKKWQIALDFKSGFDAIVAQEILDGYNYTVPNGKEYKICAKITNDPELVNKEPLSLETSTLSSGNNDVSNSCQGLVSKMTDGELYQSHSNSDHDIDSEDGRWRTRRRSRFAQSPDAHSSSFGDTRSMSRDSAKCKYRHRKRSRDTRSTFRLNSRESKHSGPLAIMHETSPPINTYGEIHLETRKCSSRKKYKKYNRAKERYKNECYSCVCHDSCNKCNGNSSTRSDIMHHIRERTNYKEKIKTYDYNKIKTDQDRYWEEEILNEKRCEATEDVMAEMQSKLDLILNKDNTNLLWKDVNMILKQVKEIVGSRMKQIKIRNDMSINKIITYYRYQYSKADDKMLLEKLMNELSGLQPQNCVDHAQSKPKKTETRNSIEHMPRFDEEDGDSKIWQQMDQVLHDINMESQSGGDEEDSKVNVTKQPNNPPNGVITDIVDVTSEPLIDKDKNKQLDIIVVVKKNNNQIPNNETKQIKNKPSSTETHVVDLNELDSELTVKKIPLKPMYYLTVKKILKQMRCHINVVAKNIDVNKFNLIIKEELRIKIRELLQGKSYMPHNEITNLFRAHNPVEGDEFFVKNIVEGMNNGKYDDFVGSNMVQIYGHDRNKSFTTVVKSEHKTLKGITVKEEYVNKSKIMLEISNSSSEIHKTNIAKDEPKIENIIKECDVVGNKANRLSDDQVIITYSTDSDTEVVIVETGSDMKVIMLSDNEDDDTDTRRKQNQSIDKVNFIQLNLKSDTTNNKRKIEQKFINDTKQRKWNLFREIL